MSTLKAFLFCRKKTRGGRFSKSATTLGLLLISYFHFLIGQYVKQIQT